MAKTKLTKEQKKIMGYARCVSVKKASQITGVKIRTITYHRRHKTIPSVKVDGEWLVKLDDVAYLTYPTMTDIAVMIGLKKSNGQDLTKHHKIPGRRKIGQVYRVPLDEALRFVQWYKKERKHGDRYGFDDHYNRQRTQEHT